MKVQVCTAVLVWAAFFCVDEALCISQTKEGVEKYSHDHEDQPSNCSVMESVTGGWVSYSLGGAPGSVLTYHCKAGHYASPVSQRVCSTEGEWSTMRLASGRRVDKAMCKEVRCPAQLQLGNGRYWPRRQSFQVGEAQEFSCLNGYTLYGSALRNCTLWGIWTGTTPVCDDRMDDCINPGTPPGALRSGDRFRVREKVQYSCQDGLVLLGSSERVCLDSHEWSGTEPRCFAPFTFDSPDTVAKAMAGSLSAMMEVSSPKLKEPVSFARTIQMFKGRLYVYILLDTSGSITKEQFEKARDATIRLIRRLDSFEVHMKFHVISYASRPKEIVDIKDYNSNNPDYVVEKILKFEHTAHGTKTGTNLYAALHQVYERMSFVKATRGSMFNDTQNIILVITDGHSNTGLSPMVALGKIRSLLGMSNDLTNEDLLDVYVFGVGTKVNIEQLNCIASKKMDEKHIFILKEYKDLEMVFDNIISDSGVTMCGIAKETIESGKGVLTRPWHVDIENCKGSILTENWILTAAHCFTPNHLTNLKKLHIKHGDGIVGATAVITHPKYDILGLKHKDVKEFYDYDIALVKLNSSIKLSSKARPLCLPCTKPSSRALKMPLNSTCGQQEEALLQLDETQAFFLSKSLKSSSSPERKQTYIQYRSKRPECIKHAATTFSSNNTVTLEEFVTDRFMCTGGSRQYNSNFACKGDSGGPLFIHKRGRYFQVAVVSWGNKELCSEHPTEYAEDARDFHISIFSVLPWLKQHLGQDLEFLPTEVPYGVRD